MSQQVYVTDRIHNWSQTTAQQLSDALNYTVRHEGLVCMLLVLALSDERMLKQAGEILRHYNLGGAQDMENRGW